MIPPDITSNVSNYCGMGSSSRVTNGFSRWRVVGTDTLDRELHHCTRNPHTLKFTEDMTLFSRNWQRWMATLGLAIALWMACLSPAGAALNDDKNDGNIFALYAGNGSIVPPTTSLAQSLTAHRPTLLVFYLDDSRDCKQFSTTVSELQSYYGRVATIVPVNSDSILPGQDYSETDPGYYYKGRVPQSVIFDQSGTVRFDESGQVAFEALDSVFREIFDLLPRSESVELKRRPVNEVNTELR